MGLFFPIIGGIFALAIIVIGIFTAVMTIFGFLIGGTAYTMQREKNIETFARVWLMVTGILTFGGMIWFVLYLTSGI